jgi:hypothetical protein
VSSGSVVIAICRNSATNSPVERVYTKFAIARLVKNCGGAQTWDGRATSARWFCQATASTVEPAWRCYSLTKANA